MFLKMKTLHLNGREIVAVETAAAAATAASASIAAASSSTAFTLLKCTNEESEETGIPSGHPA